MSIKIKITGFRNNNECTIYVDGVKLIHQVKHSPTGLEWGYAGSGPADTARSILLYVLSNHIEELKISLSQAKRLSEQLYQDFKFDFVANWKKDMFEVLIDIEKWLKQKGVYEKK